MRRSRMNRVGARGARRKIEWETAKAVHLSGQPDCQGPMSGLPDACSGVIDVHHRVPRGSGGGKDYGDYVTLCRHHHQWVEMNRAEAKRLGLLKSFWEADNDESS